MCTVYESVNVFVVVPPYTYGIQHVWIYFLHWGHCSTNNHWHFLFIFGVFKEKNMFLHIVLYIYMSSYLRAKSIHVMYPTAQRPQTVLVYNIMMIVIPITALTYIVIITNTMVNIGYITRQWLCIILHIMYNTKNATEK